MPFSVPVLQDYAKQAAAQYGVPESLFLWQIGQESSWNPNAYNANNGGTPAIGIAQFQPATAQQYGVNPYDPVSSLFGAAKYDAALHDKYGTWNSALTHYGTIHDSKTAVAAQSALMGNGGSGNAPNASDYSSFSDWTADYSKWAKKLLSWTPAGIAADGVDAVASGAENYAKRIAIALLGISLIWVGVQMLAVTAGLSAAGYVVHKAGGIKRVATSAAALATVA